MGQSPSGTLRLCESTRQRRASTPHRCTNTLQLGVRRPCYGQYGRTAGDGQGRPPSGSAQRGACRRHSERPSPPPGSGAHRPGSAAGTTHPKQNPAVAGWNAPAPSPSPFSPTAGSAPGHAGRTVDSAGESNGAGAHDASVCAAHRRADHSGEVPIPWPAKRSQTAAAPPALARRRKDAGDGAVALWCPGAGRRACVAPHGQATTATVSR